MQGFLERKSYFSAKSLGFATFTYSLRHFAHSHPHTHKLMCLVVAGDQDHSRAAQKTRDTGCHAS